MGHVMLFIATRLQTWFWETKLVFKVKSVDPKSHLLICSAIKFFCPKIVDSGIISEDEVYGFFLLDGSADLVEALYYVPGLTLEIPKEIS